MDFTQVSANLKGFGYEVSCFETVQAAVDYLDANIDGKTVGFGGSVTVGQIGLCERLDKHNTVLWHWKTPQGKTSADVLSLAQTCDVYLSSVNALAKSGEIVNIDGTCNRISATLYGHQKVYFIVGKNKIADDYEAALWRARNVAAPKNAQRLKRNTPCAEKGDRCYNCSSPERICRGLSVLWRKPGGCNYEVVLINADLGY